MRSYTITDVWGIPVRVNLSLIVFLPILAWLVASGGQLQVYARLLEAMGIAGFDHQALQTGVTPWLIGILTAVGLFASVLAHELGHAWAARRSGVGIESITLWILGGLASFEAVPREGGLEFRLAAAGPAASLLVGAVCWAGALAIPVDLDLLRFLVGWLALANLLLAGFNLLPAFPMDGGRILRGLLSTRLPYSRATRAATHLGILFALLFVVVGILYSQIMLVLLAAFLYDVARSESRSVLLEELFEGVTVGDIMSSDVATIPATATGRDLLGRILGDQRSVFLVTDEAGRVLGVVSLGDLQKVRHNDLTTTTVRSITRNVPWIRASDSAYTTFTRLSRAGSSVAIVEDEGSVEGLLSLAHYWRAITLRPELQRSIASEIRSSLGSRF